VESYGFDELLDAEGVGEQGVLPRLDDLGDAGLELAGAGGDVQHATVGLVLSGGDPGADGGGHDVGDAGQEGGVALLHHRREAAHGLRQLQNASTWPACRAPS